MNTIYNIYEALKNTYSGLLAGQDSTLSMGDKNAKEILNSPKEKLIRIVSKASEMTDKETFIFREIIDSNVQQYGNWCLCYIPKTTKANLIVASDKKLKMKDFQGFSENKREYDFRCSMDRMFIESGSNKAFDKDTKDAILMSSPKVYELNSNVKAILLGNAIMYMYRDLLYIVINDIIRMPLRFGQQLYAGVDLASI
jgi:hypothetical protein